MSPFSGKAVNETNHVELAPASNLSAQGQQEMEIRNVQEIRSDDVQKFSKEDDEAMKAMANYNGPPLILDDATRKRLLRAIDWHLMPVLMLAWGLNYMDKTALSYASIMGIKTDINLSASDYSWLGSMFYFGLLVWEYPTSRLLQRLPLAKYSASCVFIWGIVLALSALEVNFQGALALRFLLGVFEAASMPCFALLASQWYTVHEHNLRTGLWIGSNGWGQIVGGLVAYGISNRTHEMTIAGWKVLFIAIGVFTSCVGILFFFVIPDSQLNCRWLNQRDRLLAIERVRGNEQGIGNKYFKWYQFREAFTDPFTWSLLFFGVVDDIPNGGISNFFSQLIVGFGYTPQQSLLYGIPGGVVVIISCIANGWAGDHYRNRILIACIPMSLALLGMVLIIALPLTTGGNIGRLIGYYLTQCIPSCGATVLSLISSNIAGTTKKTTVAAMYLISYCAGNIIGPQTFRADGAPRYVSAEITIVVCCALCIVNFVFMHWWCKRQNRLKAAIRNSPGYVRLENHGWKDMTDRENPEFIYSL